MIHAECFRHTAGSEEMAETLTYIGRWAETQIRDKRNRDSGIAVNKQEGNDRQTGRYVNT